MVPTKHLPGLIVAGVLFGAGGMFVAIRLYQVATTTTATNMATPMSNTNTSQAAVNPVPGTLWFYGIDEAKMKDWKTYTNTELGFSYRYPADWKQFSDWEMYGNGYFTQLLPNRYYATWEARTSPKDSTPPIYQISCGPSDSTPEQMVQAEQEIDVAKDVQPYTNYTTNVSGMYYVRTPLFDLRTWLTTKAGVVCSLYAPRLEDSPLTKDEDAVGLAIINSFTWLGGGNLTNSSQ